MKKSVTIIGGAGYIGGVLTERLLAAGYEVTCLDRLIYQSTVSVLPYMSNPSYRFIYGDLVEVPVLERAIEGSAHVVLLAGLVGDPITKHYPDASHAINDVGIQRCIDVLDKKGIDRLVFVSTCSNYGMIASDELADESYPLSPLSSYARSKVAAEELILSKRGAVDYSPTILRFATAFGMAPRMRFDLTVNEFTRELALGRELEVFDAHTWRPYCHVRDFARLIQKVIEAPRADVAFEVFNAGGDVNNQRKQDILETILRFVPNGKVRFQDNGSDPRNYRVSFQKVKTVLGFEPDFTVSDGVRELLAGLDDHMFDSVDEHRNLHGNYEIEYPVR